MAETLTLAELKAQNAAESEPEQETEQVEQEEAQDTHVTIDIETEETETDDEAEQEESEEVESWLKEDVATPSDEADSGFKPSPEAAAVRKKLKAKLSEKDGELEQLKAELEQLKSGQGQQAQQANSLPPKPKLEDYDYDEAAHDAALDDWYDKKFDAKVSNTLTTKQQQEQQQAQQEQFKKSLEDAENAHYTRAEKLVAEGKVSAERYQQADRAVRESFDRLAPGKGDDIVAHLIKTLNSLGEGSEKVMYQLGVNPSKMQEVANMYSSDPSGLTAVAYLGKLQATIQSPVKRKSSAPKPSPELQGSGSGKSPEKAFLDKYKRAGDNLQKRLDIKREAKRAGIDLRKYL